ncbi:NAD(P)H-dependent flavin oxidoreductase [Thermodesulfobacteriota bacterium]
MFKTRFSEMMGIKYPIMQGSLAFLSRANLASAVSNAGGLGSLAIAGINSIDELRDEIRKIKSLTDKPFSVNMPFLPGARPVSHEQILEVVLAEKVTAVETTGRIPDDILHELKQNDVKIIHKCNKVKFAQSAERQGVDVVALLGFGSDGHPGMDEISLLVQIPKAVDTLKIPVLVAGSISDARGFMAAMAMGADGVLMGTRFLAADECPIHPKIRERLVQAQETDTVLVNTLYGNPARRIRNRTAEEVLEIEKQGASLEEILKLLSGVRAFKAWTDGDIDGGAFGCGQVIGLIDEILPAKEIIDRIINESKLIMQRLDDLGPAE